MRTFLSSICYRNWLCLSLARGCQMFVHWTGGTVRFLQTGWSFVFLNELKRCSLLSPIRLFLPISDSALWTVFRCMNFALLLSMIRWFGTFSFPLSCLVTGSRLLLRLAGSSVPWPQWALTLRFSGRILLMGPRHFFHPRVVWSTLWKQQIGRASPRFVSSTSSPLLMFFLRPWRSFELAIWPSMCCWKNWGFY